MVTWIEDKEGKPCPLVAEVWARDMISDLKDENMRLREVLRKISEISSDRAVVWMAREALND
jgi:hypothetical protein